MSLIIKGMEMPKSCEQCKMFNLVKSINDFRCCANDEWHEADFDYHNKRHHDCPIVEIPAPHGRLIDADKAATSILMMSSHPCGNSIETVNDVVEWLRFANENGNNIAFPTVIEAEVSE